MKYKVGDKVKVVCGNNEIKREMIGRVFNIKKVDSPSYYEYMLEHPGMGIVVWFAEHELEPVVKRGRPKKGEERHKTKSCREEVNALKKELKAIKSELKEFKDAVETNICNLGLEQPEEKKAEITDIERLILNNLDKEFKWIARDKNINLILFKLKPSKRVENEEWDDDTVSFEKIKYFNHLFQFIQWSDDEPYEIAKLLEG